MDTKFTTLHTPRVNSIISEHSDTSNWWEKKGKFHFFKLQKSLY